MKRREHEAIVKEVMARQRAELEQAARLWAAEVDDRQEVIERYAEALTEQDEVIARLRACLARAVDNQDGWAFEARELLGR